MNMYYPRYVRYVNDEHGETQFVILPIAEYYRLTGDDNDDWEDMPYDAAGLNDVSIPHAIVKIMMEKEVNLFAAWRIHRGLTQAQVAEKAGMSMAELVQLETDHVRQPAEKREQFAAIYDCLPEQLVL